MGIRWEGTGFLAAARREPYRGLLPGGYVQLLEPLGADTPVGRFLARRGEGIHHVGYGVSDIRQALTAIGGSGVRLLDERPRHGSMGASIAFLHPADLGGVLTELVGPPIRAPIRTRPQFPAQTGMKRINWYAWGWRSPNDPPRHSSESSLRVTGRRSYPHAYGGLTFAV